MKVIALGESGPRLEDRPRPAGGAEAVVRVTTAGVCATDLELVKGYMGFRGVLGHEWVGVVEAAPDSSWLGRRVVGDINCPCRRCAVCTSGRPTHCPRRSVVGIQGRDGAFAEFLAIPCDNLHAVPEGVRDDAAVFVEPLAAACQILEQVHVRPSTRVAVLGAGRLGQLIARVLELTGCALTVVSRNPGHLCPLPSSILGTVDGGDLGGLDLVVDCTGSPDGLALATRLVRARGTIVLKTTVHDVRANPVNAWVIDEVSVIGSRCGPFEPALRLLASGMVDPTPLVTSRLPLSQGLAALSLAAERDQVKVLLDVASHSHP